MTHIAKNGLVSGIYTDQFKRKGASKLKNGTKDRYLIEKKTQMAHKHIKRYQTSLLIKEMYLKLQ